MSDAPIFDECCREHGRYDTVEDALAAWTIGQPVPFSEDDPDGSGER